MLKKLISWYKNRGAESDVLSSKNREDVEESFNVSKRTLDISQPVIAFVETFKNNPRRFSIALDWHLSGPENYYSYTLKDRSTGEEFSATVGKGWSWDGRNYTETWYDYPSFLTADELKYVLETLQEYYIHRKERLTTLRKVRIGVSAQRERNRLMGVYKNEVDSTVQWRVE